MSELEGVVASHGWTLDGMHTCELIPSEETLLLFSPTRNRECFILPRLNLVKQPNRFG